jgi:hypothetical protein
MPTAGQKHWTDSPRQFEQNFEQSYEGGARSDNPIKVRGGGAKWHPIGGRLAADYDAIVRRDAKRVGKG